MTVLAAGAVIWRRKSDESVEVLLVERTKHQDISIPKGKLDPGESLPECAVREMLEETGIEVTLGAPLGTTEYRLPNGSDKVVRYWQAEAKKKAIKRSVFKPNSEIKALYWLPLSKAKKRCSYIHDVRMLERFEARIDQRELDTVAIVALRHAKAEPYAKHGGDSRRELSSRGRKQAKAVAPGLAAFGIDRILASTATRCQQTAAPLSKLIGEEVKTTKDLSQDYYSGDAENVRRRVAKAVRKGRSTVLCSHQPVLPAVAAAVAIETESEVTTEIRGAANLSTAEFSVFHVKPGEHPRLVAIETHSAPE